MDKNTNPKASAVLKHALKACAKRLPITIAVLITIGLSLWVVKGNSDSSSPSDFFSAFTTSAEEKEKQKLIDAEIDKIQSDDCGGYNEVLADYEEHLKNTQSDIDGMTMWDKVQKGLDPKDGSDTDGDGLTDKEEIETYHSDPLKASTAGDLYTDGYKVAHDMDLNKKYEYEGEQKFPGNTAEGVELKASDPISFNATCQDLNDYYEIDGANIIKSLTLYRFKGTINISIGQAAKDKYNITSLSDCAVYIGAWGDSLLKPVEFSVNASDQIVPHYDFDLNETYGVVITDHSATAARLRSDKLPHAKQLNGGTNGEIDNVHKAYVLMFPWYPQVGLPMFVYYVPTNEKSDQEMKANFEKYYWALGGSPSSYKNYDHDKFFYYYPITEEEYELRYKALRDYWPCGYNDLYKEFIAGGLTSEDETVPKNLGTYVVTYLDYDTICKDLGVLNGDEIKYSFVSPIKDEPAFDPSKNAVPFANLATVDTEGVCSGIAALTVQNWNQENINLSETATVKTNWRQTASIKDEKGKDHIYGVADKKTVSGTITNSDDVKILTTKGALGQLRDSSFGQSNTVLTQELTPAVVGGKYKIKDGQYLLQQKSYYALDYSTMNQDDTTLANWIEAKWRNANNAFDKYYRDSLMPTSEDEYGMKLVQNGTLYSWDIIKSMLDELQSGRIMLLNLTGYSRNGTEYSSVAHSVVVYGARQDTNNPNFYYFYIYDPNYPNNKYPGGDINNVMTVVKVPDPNGNTSEDGFSYYYAPFNTKDNEMMECATSLIFTSKQLMDDTPPMFQVFNASYKEVGRLDHKAPGKDIIIDNETGETSKK